MPRHNMNSETKTSSDDPSDRSAPDNDGSHDPLHLAQLVLDSAVDYAIITLSQDGTITSWNEGGERIMGWTAKEAVGQHVSMFFTPEDVETDRPRYEMSVAASEGHAQDERWHVAKGGRRFWASGRMMPLVSRPERDALTVEKNLANVTNAKQVGYLKILRDRTGQRKEILRQTALLDLGNQLRDMLDEQEMADLAAETIARTLDASRAGHGYLDATGSIIDIRADWNAPGGQSIVGRHRYETYGNFIEELRGGGTVAMEDCRHNSMVPDPMPLERIGIRGLLNVPLMERGRLKAVMFVHDIRPRNWADDEIRFVRGVADRTYAAIDRARSDADRDLVMRELAHRMKNVLTVAQVIAVQSLRHAPSLVEGRRVVTERLGALGRAQDILTSRAAEGACIRNVVEQALAPYFSENARITVGGPEVDLTGPQVLGLTLALHELGTNAGKYGALSVPDGRIEVSWTLTFDRDFLFSWTEKDGPHIGIPSHKGFGMQILNRVTGGYFNGTSDIEFKDKGVRFTIKGTLNGQ